MFGASLRNFMLLLAALSNKAIKRPKNINNNDNNNYKTVVPLTLKMGSLTMRICSLLTTSYLTTLHCCLLDI